MASVACSRAVCRVTEQQLYRSQVVDLGRLRSAQRVCAVSRTIETGALHPPMDDAGVLPRREMRPPAERAREPGSTPVSVEGSQPLADCAPGLLGDLELDGRPVFFWTTVARSRTLPPAHTSSILTQMRSQSRNLLSMARLNIARSRLRPSSCRRTRIAQTFFGFNVFLNTVDQTATHQTGRPATGRAEWLHEIKFDGYRMHARLNRGAVRLLTRTGLDWTPKY